MHCLLLATRCSRVEVGLHLELGMPGMENGVGGVVAVVAVVVR